MVSKLYFDPPLWLQRQSWVLRKLRQEQVDSTVDVGCSNGTLLSALMQPAFQTDTFPTERFPLLEYGLAATSSTEELFPKRHWIRASADINLRRLVGLDIDAEALRNARSTLSLHGQVIAESRPRWRSLEVELFEGRLETENERLKGCEAFVATEVIEHLDEAALEQFGPTILGRYRPRILLLTTPNYCFNENFGGDLSTRPGFPDPSGRTNRVFRHDDHKFEWTPEEFRRWCESLADAHGYEVTVDGVGEGIHRRQAGEASNGKTKTRRPRTSDNDDERLRYASQTAFFRRRSASPRLHDHRAAESANGKESEYFSIDANLNQASAAIPLVAAAATHVHCGEEGRAEDHEDLGDNDDDDGRDTRRARSRRPEKLPFLSSPTSTAPSVAPLSLDAAVKVPNPVTPFVADTFAQAALAHRPIWQHTYASWQAAKHSGSASDVRGAPAETVAGSAEEIIAAVLEKQRQLFIAAQWSDYDEGGAKLRADTTAWVAKAKLLDVWCDDAVRGSCAGKIGLLLDVLRLAAAEGEVLSSRETKLSLSGHDEAPIQVQRDEQVVGSNRREWELRVIADRRHPVARDAHAVVGGAAAAEEEEADESSLVDSDLWLVHTNHETVRGWYDNVQKARRWIPQSYNKPWKSKGLGAAAPVPPASWE
ncbi:hypothetical protein ACQY0O_001965 [Thecaphora frezii]|nr:hypothetical protein [Thecaphora frezii]